VGIQISGIGAMCPERRNDLARLGFRALLAATLASCMCGAVVGIVA
jgi:CNT family concentrative nucleoside transporter